jgi:mono/diheme cytochrome c family protein
MKRMIPRSGALAALFLLACTSKPAPEPTAPAPEPAAPASEPSPEPAATAPEPAPGPTATAPEPAPEPTAPASPAPAPRPDPAKTESHAQLLASEKAAFERARPVFQKHCARCHASGGKKAKPKTLGHFDMTRYPFGGHHADQISATIRKSLAIGGGEPSMPMDDPGAVEGSELSLVSAWAEAYDKAHAAGAQK